MDVQIKHNGTNISGFVEKYEREHKICTGIGVLQVEVVRTVGRTFNPWDTIDIHENGDFKVRYYISSVEDDIPRGTLVIDCQDESKRIIDYFIPDTYIIDYPSYTRYWIEKFLDEAGVDYQFNTSSQGSLISNNTQLGLQTAYEQILTLLQMSGWYMFFDGDGKAVIGPLNADLADVAANLNKTDILSINRISDDKMLRNRALVLGAFNIFTLSYAVADVTVHTRWNYDNDDIRSIVISNSNIPDTSSAYFLANQIIKEFARITIEKHIEVWGARNFTLGDAVRVFSNVWRGKGLITTFGVSMSKEGLITKIILDERCPRLFGFFNFGDYVYVGTFGAGVWRKHIKFDHTWYDFSSGLTNLNITDLHVNNGILGSVGSSGQMYWTTDEGPWNPLSVQSLPSFADDIVISGVGTQIEFSGIAARATIVDKIGNTVKFGVDTWSGYNWGDYFLNYDEMTNSVTFSGITLITGTTISGSHRGWILEYSPVTGQLVGGLGSGIYPIHYSGIYNLTVIDLENDGKNDYVSVRLGGAAQVGGDGRHITQPFATTFDFYSNTAFANIGGTYDSDRLFAAIYNGNSVITVEDAPDNVPRLVYLFTVNLTPTFALKEVRYTREQDEFGNWEIVKTTTTSSNTGNDPALAIHYAGENEYILYYYRLSGGGSTYNFYRRIWNAEINFLGTEELLATYDYSSSGSGHSGKVLGHYLRSVTVNNVIYAMVVRTYHAPSVGGSAFESTHLHVTMHKITMATGGISANDIMHVVTGQKTDEPTWTEYYHISGTVSNPTEPTIEVVQDGGGVKVIGWYGVDYHHDFNAVDSYRYVSDWFVSGDSESAAGTKNYEAEVRDPIDFISNSVQVTRKLVRSGLDANVNGWSSKQLNVNRGFMIRQSTSISELGFWGFSYDSQGVLRFHNTQVSTDFWRNPERIFPLFYANLNYYIARDGSGDFWLCDSVEKDKLSKFTAPAGWTLIKPLTSMDAYFNVFYWAMRDTNFDYWIVPATLTTFYTQQANKISSVISTGNESAIIAGSFVLGDISRSAAPPEDSEVTFIYLENLGGYLVLQREGSDYNLIQRSTYPIRLDISNTSPVLTVGSGDGSFISNFVYDTELLQVLPSLVFPFIPTSGIVDDYRYTFLEPMSSGITQSGYGIRNTGLYIRGSGIYSFDVTTYSGGFTQLFQVPSGYGYRLETSNFGIGGQYIFITASGDSHMSRFYQQDPQASFVHYSGLPNVRSTIIRLDDRI